MEWIFLIVAFSLVVVAVVFVTIKQNKYQKAQQENNTDKQMLLDLMQRVMEEEYSKYDYIVGYFTKVQQKIGSTVYYYFPYVMAFTQEEFIIFPFIKKEGRLYIRNRMDVDFSQVSLRKKVKKNGMTLTFKIAGEKMPINLNPVIKGSGMEKSDRPLCIYQEEEYQKLLSYLPEYEARAKKA